MVALLDIQSPTIAAIDLHYEKSQSVRNLDKLDAWTLASDCERQGVYAFRWAHEPKAYSGKIVRENFWRSRNIDELVTILNDVGVRVDTCDPHSFEAYYATASNGHYEHKIQGIVTGIIEAPKTPHLFYADYRPAKDYSKIMASGVEAAMPDRYVSIQIGMHLHDLTRAFYMVRCKDSGDIHAERIHYNAAHALAFIAKADRISQSNHMPAKVSSDPNFFKCKAFKCPAYAICHEGAMPLRTCRTCIHSDAITDGQWACARHNRTLTIDDQKAGCPHHLYLHALVPGIQIDTNETNETVTYEMPDGTTWVDGGERLHS